VIAFRTNQAGRRCRIPLLAAVIVVSLGAVGQAPASVISAASAVEDTHGRDCHCGVKCRGASCCCGPRRSTVPPPAPIQNADQVPLADPSSSVDDGSGPCMGAAPCADPIMPTGSAATGAIGKVAAMGGVAPIAPPPIGRDVFTSSDRLDPSFFTSRLDEPPEVAASR
jgi:hypothetical protein